MEIFDVTQIALERALEGSAARQRALADNVANANTPGFKRSDVDFHGVLSSALGASDADGGESTLDRVAFTKQTDTSTSSRADGNNVDIDEEMLDLTNTNVTYNALIQTTSARLAGLRSVINGGSR